VLAGGAAAVATRAQAVLEAGDHALACGLIELASQAAPTDRGIHAVRAEIYGARAKHERSLMARGVFAAAADASRRNS